jgi:hypothetical protein
MPIHQRRQTSLLHLWNVTHMELRLDPNLGLNLARQHLETQSISTIAVMEAVSGTTS